MTLSYKYYLLNFTNEHIYACWCSDLEKMEHKSSCSRTLVMKRCFNGKWIKQTAVALVVISFLCLCFCELLLVSEFNRIQYMSDIKQNGTLYKTIFSDGPDQRKSPKILLYTTFFGRMVWYDEYLATFPKSCPFGCTLTDDKSEIQSVDAVIYHFADISWQATGYFQDGAGAWFSFPEYRRADQVWALYNVEPLTMVWGSTNSWQGVFNWTWSYTRAADIVSPYGGKRQLTDAEKDNIHQSTFDYNYYDAKIRSGGIAMISHCTDDARRYRVISKLRHYIDVRVVGRCGEGCPDGYLSCNNLLGDYKFYLAFENSDCYDYVSEKYWRALERKQIPIVAWKLNMSDIVIPGSFINVYDFVNLDEAGRFIQKVNTNSTLYNSFFKWHKDYTLHYTNGMCELCKKLQDGTSRRMAYHDMDGWIHNNTCKPMTVRIRHSKFLTQVTDKCFRGIGYLPFFFLFRVPRR